jgi:hypothetical protein
MGCCHPFRCPACDYAINVSGGPDMGMSCYTQTIHCKSCKEVGDVVTLRFEWRQWPARDRDSTDVPNCPADEMHAVVAWSNGGPCPKCGTAMEQGADSIMWD